jgi:hypothetical protein
LSSATTTRSSGLASLASSGRLGCAGAAERPFLEDAAHTLLANESLAGAQLEGILERVGKEPGPRLASNATG